jgi:hypothetical protein
LNKGFSKEMEALYFGDIIIRTSSTREKNSIVLIFTILATKKKQMGYF